MRKLAEWASNDVIPDILRKHFVLFCSPKVLYKMAAVIYVLFVCTHWLANAHLVLRAQFPEEADTSILFFHKTIFSIYLNKTILGKQES